jgi:hypothetical protein
MRLSRLVGLCLLSTGALAGPTRPATWAVEYSSADGKYFGRDLSFFTKEECEAAIPRVLKEWPGYQPAHCIEWKNGQFIGSWDPQLAEGSWAMEFTTGDGKYSRAVGYPSKESCKAAIPTVLRNEAGRNGHCIEWKDGHYVGSHDPAWAGK